MIDSKSVILINITEGYSKAKTLNEKRFMSGIVLLAAIHLKKYRKRNGYVWGMQHFNIAKSCKDNILTDATKHHKSAGYYYSWGNRGNYRTVDLSSVTQYSYKKKKGVVGELNSFFLEECMNVEIKNSILTMKNHLPFLTTIISPAIGVAFNMQHQHGDVKIEEIF